MLFLKQIILPILFLLILAWVVFYIQPPESWPAASIFQILILFVPLLMFFTFTINFFIRNLPKSFSLGLGLMVILVLKALDQINLITILATLTITFLLARSFKKGLTRMPKIPKLKHFGGRK